MMGIDIAAERRRKKREAERNKSAVLPPAAKLIKCPACAREISRKSTSCVHCGEPIPSEVRMRGLATRKERTSVMTTKEREESTKAIIMVLVVMAAVICYFWPSAPPPAAPKKVKTPVELQRENIRWVAITFVQHRLKSPSSAKFYNGTPPTEFNESDGTWTVVGDVDSQNSFGAMIRSRYVINLKPVCENYKSMSCWSVVSASID